MNISILGVIPWRDFDAKPRTAGCQQYVISTLMERLYGPTAGMIATVLIMWTAFSSVFSLLLGYSRVPMRRRSTAIISRYFRRCIPKHHFPYVSLLIMGGIAALFCFFRLADVIAALVVIRIMVQFSRRSSG